MNQNLKTGFQSFTRKLPFDTCVKERYRSVLKDRILSASEDIRQLLFRAQMFVNYFIILHLNENITGCINDNLSGILSVSWLITDALQIPT
jgi:hypothetical protein